jgi:glycosyltransferase involved in cell wall biosynthesis
VKVFHLSSAPFSGGAARAGFRLHQGLMQEKGVESFWIDADHSVRGEGVLSIPGTRKGQSFRNRLSRRRWSKGVSRHFSKGATPASNPIGWGTVRALEELPIPDVWNLHWVSWFLHWETMLPWMAERAPIVWTLHDLNAMQGVWHYLSDESTTKQVQLEQEAIEMKQKALALVPCDRLTFVGPSKWMVDSCRQSPVTKNFPVHHIPYGVNQDAFAPRDGALLRRMMGISLDKFVIGFIAADLRDPRKGMLPFQSSLRKLVAEQPDVHLITVGNGEIDSGALTHTHLGSLSSDQLLSNFYSACDVFVCPSLQDNLPNTVLESIACGTPVVGFDVGGIPDMVRSGESGYLVSPVGDGEALSKTLLEITNEPQQVAALRPRTLALASSEYGLQKQANAYTNLYSHRAKHSS